MYRNLTIRQGATFRARVLYKKADGSEFNLAGYSARMQVRESHTSETALLSLTSDPPAGITITAGSGIIDIEVAAGVTAALTAPLSAVYDLEIESGGGVVSRILEGGLRITPEVTR